MPNPERNQVALTDDDIALLVEALDSHEYWQLSDPTWRHSGAVILPSDDPDAGQIGPSHPPTSGRDRGDRALPIPR
jgi:hypothetical protein